MSPLRPTPPVLADAAPLPPSDCLALSSLARSIAARVRAELVESEVASANPDLFRDAVAAEAALYALAHSARSAAGLQPRRYRRPGATGPREGR